MGRHSSIRRLPPEIREIISDLRASGRTVDGILDKARELQVNVTRTALGHHVKQLDAISAELRRSRMVADRDRAGHADCSWSACLGLAGTAGGAIDDGYRPVLKPARLVEFHAAVRVSR